VFLHPKSAKTLEKIDATNKGRIKSCAEGIASSPEKAGKQLSLSDFYSLRIGDYQAIYEIGNNQKQVIVLFIGYRRNVYDDFIKIV
jgi:mRNA-degrading endonuclease RelE of RelBE toxin-antitoxin system